MILTEVTLLGSWLRQTDGVKYRISQQYDEHGWPPGFRWMNSLLRMFNIYAIFERVQALLHSTVRYICKYISSLHLEWKYAFTCGRWLVKMVSSDLFVFPVHWKSTVIESHRMASSMSRIIYLWISPSKLPKLSLGRHRIWYKGTLMLSIASLISYHTVCLFYLSPQVCHSALWCEVTCDADQWGSYKCIVNVKHISIFYA